MDNHIEMRLTPSKTPDYSWETFESWLKSLTASIVIACKESKSYHTGSPATPHFHLYFKTTLQKNSIRTSFKKKFTKALGNASFKFSIVKNVDSYLRYVCKYNTPVYLKGLHYSDIESYAEEFKEQFIKNKKAKKALTKVQKIKQYLLDQQVEITPHPHLIYHILEYHHSKGCTWTEYDIKKIYNFIIYETKSTDQRMKFAEQLFSNM